MFSSKDGKKFGSAYVAKKRDAMHGEGDKNLNTPETPMEQKEESRTGNEGEALMSKANANAPDNDVKSNPENVDPKAVVAEHGPALSTEVHSDHVNNEHHVMSHHKSGHVHHSKHGSMQDAHSAATELASTGEGEKPAGDGMSENESPEPDGFSMPKLA